MKKHNDISLMDEKMIDYIKNNDGLCMKKFHADIITKNIDYSSLIVGDVITVDNRKIRLTRVGKPCFQECSMTIKPCMLSKCVAFGVDA